MGGKRAVERDQPQILHPALSEQKTIERIAGLRLGLGIGKNMPDLNRQESHAGGLEKSEEIGQRQTGIESSEAGFEGDLPDARGAGKAGIFAGLDCLRDARGKRCQLSRRQAEKNVGVEQQPHRLRQRPQQNVLRQRRVEVVRDMHRRLFHAAPAQIVLAGGEVEAGLLAVRDEIDNRLAIAGDDDRFALLHQAGERGEAILGFLDRDNGHPGRIATGSYPGKSRLAR